MAPITPPDKDGNYPDRGLECQEAINDGIQSVLADAAAGWGTSELFDAAEEIIRNLRLGCGADPDPQADPAIKTAEIPSFALNDPKQGP